MRKQNKLLLVGAALVCSCVVGLSIHSASADVDTASLLKNWFDANEREAINRMDQEISAEKEELLKQLRMQVKQELQTASSQLEKYRADQTSKSVEVLRAHAAQISQSIVIDTSSDQQAIDQSLQAIVDEAIAKMNGVASANESEPENMEQPSPPITENGESNAGEDSTSTDSGEAAEENIPSEIDHVTTEEIPAEEVLEPSDSIQAEPVNYELEHEGSNEEPVSPVSNPSNEASSLSLPHMTKEDDMKLEEEKVL
ncbi:hypothetical protein [Paenisporosarcina cavernae]|uniref:DUF5667 domain-containing protein n=1 Tax=Paenisporosarcina cavernae TaxID=2320858 RepID=A0A385YTN7_9BACL|nr:hypothetical protein [Paenisporosarcina cavernae]AYC29904.1 hypothetical protein D3873_08355 [Paenisporosarcina cavernae]